MQIIKWKRFTTTQTNKVYSNYWVVIKYRDSIHEKLESKDLNDKKKLI